MWFQTCDRVLIKPFLSGVFVSCQEHFTIKGAAYFHKIHRDDDFCKRLFNVDITKDYLQNFSIRNTDGTLKIFKKKFSYKDIAIETADIKKVKTLFQKIFSAANEFEKISDTNSMVMDLASLYLASRLDNSFIFNSNDSIYLPAARSGLVQSHRLLTMLLWKKLPEIGLKELHVPQFPKLISDFLMNMVNIPGKESPYFEIAQQLEREMLQGEISIVSNGAATYPELRYRSGKLDIPIHRSSSMVSEIAPLVLYLKYLVGPNSVLIIEEPEAHLHPQNQLILAKYLVRLVRQGLNLIITTHSDYLLEQLGSFIMLSGVEEKRRKQKYGYQRDDYLKPADIGVYVFKRQPRLNAFKIESVKIDPISGINMDEYSDVFEALSNEAANIRTDLQKKDKPARKKA